MKAITVMQPWATLIARGIKTIETRPAPPNGDMRPDGVRGLPGLAVNRGERIAIHAAASKPPDGSKVGAWSIRKRGTTWTAVQGGTHGPIVCPSCPHTAHLPLGAVVATAVVADALPIYHVAQVMAAPGRAIWPNLQINGSDPSNMTIMKTDGDDHHRRLDDQAPLGDFTPGRWGWLLTDVEPLPEPIPAKGKQGVWEWTP